MHGERCATTRTLSFILALAAKLDLRAQGTGVCDRSEARHRDARSWRPDERQHSSAVCHRQVGLGTDRGGGDSWSDAIRNVELGSRGEAIRDRSASGRLGRFGAALTPPFVLDL